MKRIKAERLRKGLTQLDEAVKLGIHPSALSSIENGFLIPRPTSNTARRMENPFPTQPPIAVETLDVGNFGSVRA